MKLVILRHGATVYSEEHLYAGSTDVALSEEGCRQAARAGVHSDVSKVYVSTMQRAQRTASICFPEARQVIVDGLQEMDFGDFEGRSSAQMEHDLEYRAWVDALCRTRCPHGEIRTELVERCARALNRIVGEACSEDAACVIVVAHGGTIMAAMERFSVERRDYFEWQVGNCEGYSADVILDGDSFRLESPRPFENLDFLEGLACGSASTWRDPASFFTNKECPYFPCHQGIPEDEFNCLFCYCPLYALGPDCGGHFSYTKSGLKSCMGCSLPHRRDNGAKMVMARFEMLAELAKREKEEPESE